MSGTHDQAARDHVVEALLAAVGDAVRAPSIFNSQPWVWTMDAPGLALHADAWRRLAVVDPDGTQMLLSCGAALHHAQVSLAAQGWAVEVDRLPGGDADETSPYGPADQDPYGFAHPLARLRLTGRTEPDPASVALRAAIQHRRTDRRPFGDEPVPPAALAALTAAASAHDTWLHRVRLDQMPMLAIAVAAAAATELANPRYRIELIQWTNRPEWSNDGVPPETAVRHVPRRVPVRDFALFPEQGIEVTPGGDRGAAYLVLHGPRARRLDWLRAGEALSAVLLTATAAGLATATFTDVLEVEHPRQLVRGLLPGLSLMHPYAVIRCGYATGGDDLPASPRRAVDEVLHRASAPPAVDAAAAAG